MALKARNSSGVSWQTGAAGLLGTGCRFDCAAACLPEGFATVFFLGGVGSRRTFAGSCVAAASDTISPLCPPASSITSKVQGMAGWRPALNLTVPQVVPFASAASNPSARRAATPAGNAACAFFASSPNLERAAAFIHVMVRVV